MANKWIVAAATAALFCSIDWLGAAGTRQPPATPVAPATTGIDRPALADVRIEGTGALVRTEHDA